MAGVPVNQPHLLLSLTLLIVPALAGCDAIVESDGEPVAPQSSEYVRATPFGSGVDAASPSEGGPDGGSADSGEIPPSCQTTGPGLTNCGSESQSCCTNLLVEGGTYYRTYTYDGGSVTGEADPATVSSFRLDKYDVTVGRFRQFVNAVIPNSDGGAPLGWTPPEHSGMHKYLNGGHGLVNSASELVDGGPVTYEEGWSTTHNNEIAPTNANLNCSLAAPSSGSTYATWTDTPGSQENLPINCVNWYEAYAFCIWDKAFLPSEAEWAYAAAGGSEEREYAWGTKKPGTACPGTGCEYAIYDCAYPDGSGPCTGVTNIAPVGTATKGKGLWGQLDLAGEMYQINLDWSQAYVDPCTDCAYLTEAAGGGYRVIRGSSFDVDVASLQSEIRGGWTQTHRVVSIGFRCARDP